MSLSRMWVAWRKANANARLIVAIRAGREDLIHGALGDGADGSARESDEAAITVAGYVRRKMLIALGRNTCGQFLGDDSPCILLYYRVRRRSSLEATALRLLRPVAQISAADRELEGKELLPMVIRYRHSAILDALLERGVSPRRQLDPETELPSIDGMQALLRHGASTELRDLFGNTVLFHANAAETEELIRHGCQVNAQNGDGETALFEACKEGDDKKARLLIDHGANVKIKSHHGETPILLAASQCNIETLDRLVRAGGDINQTNQRGDTCLIYALINPHAGVFQWVLARVKNVNFADDDGNTVLDVALQDPRKYCVNKKRISDRQLRIDIQLLRMRGAAQGHSHRRWSGYLGN